MACAILKFCDGIAPLAASPGFGDLGQAMVNEEEQAFHVAALIVHTPIEQ